MRKKNTNGRENVVLDPGDHYVTDQNIIISTLLGSCVSACLFDPVHKIMGMNHFLLSNTRYQKSGKLITSEAGRYGIHAMELVINGMLALGATRKYMRAKAFGGGNMLGIGKESSNFFCVGEINVRFIREFLDNENIRLVTSDLGGTTGRVIRFIGGDYSVYVRKIQKTAAAKLEERDRSFWNKTIQTQEEKTTEIDLW
ncbi:MAG: chemotaxis protein CheD [Proteobacteria bacterium]|nr:chemotaxis protein CheD [Pseudomonadota bacterium]